MGNPWVWGQRTSDNVSKDSPSSQQGLPPGNSSATTFSRRSLPKMLGPRMLGRATPGVDIQAVEFEITTSGGVGATSAQAAQPEASPVAGSPPVAPVPNVENRPISRSASSSDAGTTGPLSGGVVCIT